MMKNPRNLLIFAVLGGIAGLALGFGVGRFSAAPVAKQTATHDASKLTAVLMAQQDAWNAGDIESFMQGYLKSEQLRFASGGDVTLGWDETLSRYQDRYSDRAKMGTLKFDIKDVTILGQDDGLAFGQWTLIRDADKPTGLFTLHLRKTGEGWKVVSDHTSSAEN
jgi:ketosteroid isomerase-like protein